jgi:hypothetical protein
VNHQFVSTNGESVRKRHQRVITHFSPLQCDVILPSFEMEAGTRPDA